MPRNTLLSLMLILVLCTLSARAETRRETVAGKSYNLEEVFYEDFSRDLGHWLPEGDAAVNQNEGWLEVDATRGKAKAATVWCRQEFEGSQLVEYDVRLLGESLQSNVNMFLLASNPQGGGILESSGSRDGSYDQYHKFPNYLITILNGTGPDRRERLRVRTRLDPGFELADERWFEPLVFGRVYHVAYLIRPPTVTVLLDGCPLVVTRYREKLARGFHGLRIWHTHSVYDNFRVSRIVE